MIKILVILFSVLCLSSPVHGASKDKPETGNDSFPADYREVETDPQAGEGIQKYAVEGQEGPHKSFGVQPIHDNQVFATFRADRFEHQWREKDVQVLLWDAEAWMGTDWNKLVVKSEGEYVHSEDEVEEAGLELLYARTISRFWDVQAGIRHDFEPSPSRSFLALGVEGLAPQWFEIDATAYLSEDGDLSVKVEAEYELLLTQRLALAPRLEAGLSAQDVPEYETWQGITGITLGCRLMYHIRRELAPYIGVNWNRKIGETAHMIEKEGEDVDSTAFVAGMRFWF